MKQIQIDRTEEEREELVKQWISDNWLTAVIAVLIAIGIVYGFDYYKKSKANALNQMAVEVADVQKAISANQLEEATKRVSNIQQEASQTAFSSIATLSLAKRYVDEEKYQSAIEQYDWLITHADDLAMRDIAKLRKARVQANLKQNNQSVETLSSLEGKAYITEANLLKGDILLSAKQYEQAQKAYEMLKDNPAINPQIVQQRLDLLAIKKQQAEK
ncbi:MAG: hypothetical protein CSA44_01885 [Gammaproteobacteria bacterium]|nr:MAG: hypothetical protein CSA44_01885 [Gammaproteobacteria bacterium]